MTPGATSPPGDGLGVFALHGVLLHTGKVLWWSGHAERVMYAVETWAWDPTILDGAGNPDISKAERHVPPTGAGGADIDPFCCYHLQLDDGRILTVGGAGMTDGTGIKEICIFDPGIAPGPAGTAAWTYVGAMAVGRWYPTAVHVGDGRIMVFSGRDETGGALAQIVEVLGPPTYLPSTLTVYEPTAVDPHAAFTRSFPTYPSLHLVPGGRIVHTGTTWRYEYAGAPGQPRLSFQFGPTASEARCEIYPGVPVRDREEGTAVLLSPAQAGRILVLGGARMPAAAHGANARDPNFKTDYPLAAGTDPKSAQIIDTQTSPPTVTNLPAMNQPRINASAVLLVDGKVLVLGGHDFYKWSPAQVPSLACEIFDPTTNTFKVADSLHQRRTYHSTALLLPDGTVVVSGGVDPTNDEPGNPGRALNQKTFEIYKPPYMFITGTVPSITGIMDFDGTADQVTYGRKFSIDTPQAAAIRQVVLMRPGAMTHHTDSEQRHIPLKPKLIGAKLEVTMPAEPSIAPAGYYMVFIINSAGRPCDRARFVRLKSLFPAPPPPPPPATSKPLCLIATAALGSPAHPQIEFLREVRDKELRTTREGRAFATLIERIYYSFSPAVADRIAKREIRRTLVRYLAVWPVLVYVRLCWTLVRPLPTREMRSRALVVVFAVSFAVAAGALGIGATTLFDAVSLLLGQPGG